jgi:hypothetical protein
MPSEMKERVLRQLNLPAQGAAAQALSSARPLPPERLLEVARNRLRAGALKLFL